MTTIEVAVLAFVFLAIAVAMVGLFINFANDTVNNPPAPETLNFGE